MSNPVIQLTGSSGGLSISTVATMDAVDEKCAFAGQVFWADRDPSPKTMGSTSKIHFRTGVVTFADAATNVRIGLQDCQTTTVTFLTPDGTFDVYADVAGNSGIISSSDDQALKSVTLSTSGSKSVAHGDTIAVVFDMTARGGTDSLTILGLGGPGALTFPISLSYTTSWFLGSAVGAPWVMLEASDGTLGTFVGGIYIAGINTLSFNSSGTPDEYGLIFQVPFACTMDAVVAIVATNTVSMDYTIKVYSNPLGTPTVITSIARLGEQGNNSTSERPTYFLLPAEVTLQPNTDYCISIEATGSGSMTHGVVELGSADHREINGLTNCRMGSRTNGSGAFSETLTSVPLIAARICAFDDGTGLGRASLNLGV
jgi:hypothetical protein